MKLWSWSKTSATSTDTTDSDPDFDPDHTISSPDALQPNIYITYMKFNS